MSTADRIVRRRRLSADEQALWELVTRAVKPIRKKRPEKPKEAAAPPPPAPETQPSPKPVPVRRPAAMPAKPAPPPQPPLASIERRLVQRVRRGAASIDARLDLHGHTQEIAHRELLRFLRIAQAKDARLVLVITGKGAREGAAPFGSGRGVLRRLVPQWLALPEFRAYVIGYDQAHVSHGGEGALYVRVRRAR